MQNQLDETYWAILQALQENARVSFAELGKRVGLTAPAVAERVRKMEDAGIINGYHADVNLAALGLPISVIIQLASPHGRSKDIVEMVKDTPEVTACHNLTGRDCYMIQAAVASIPHLETLLAKLSSYGQTTTSIILSSPVRRRVIERTTIGPVE
jgi:Lrp/AsnC family transcriptional regulator, leucine-responsive regulatory protein